MGEQDSGVTTRDYIEVIINDLKETVKDQLAELRSDIKHMQANYVTRTEHEAVIGFLKDDIASTRDEFKEYKSDREDSLGKAVAVTGILTGLIVAAIEIVISVLK